ncbi:MAG: N-acetylmuramoyl-L-alanine amidase [Thermodesulfobacteriota bacterium]
MPCASPKAGFPRGSAALKVLLVLVLLFPVACARAGAVSPKKLFLSAEQAERTLMKSRKQKGQRDQWLSVIEKYKKVYAVAPDGPWAAAGLFKAAEMYEGLAGMSRKSQDAAEAADLYQRVVLRFPESAYAPRAKRAVKRLGPASQAQQAPAAKPPPDDGGAPVISSLKARSKDPAAPESDEVSSVIARAMAQEPPPACPAEPPPAAVRPEPGAPVTVSGIRFWTSPSYTRVVIDATGEAPFSSHLLKEDPENKMPPRLFLDICGAKLSKDTDSTVPIQDDLLSRVRAGQNTSDTVRVVMDIKSMESYKVFSLKNPFRIVVDVRGDKGGSAKAAAPAAAAQPQPENGKMQAGALARQLALSVSTVVVDAGHGGKDPGALGYQKGVKEKDVTLSLAKRVAKLLQKETGVKVILTRDKDRYLTLEERTAIANTKGADLFISIHANAHPRRSVQGIETYFLNLATDEESIRTAALENATSRKSISDLQGILQDLLQNAKVDESSRLAREVQTNLCQTVSQRFGVENKGVKQAPFYVLLGAQMPAVLVETGFISNQEECKRLTSSAYQDHVAEGIVAGVAEYVKALSPPVAALSGGGG